MDAAAEPDEVPVDVLRRRLYRPGATAEDLRRYEAARRTVPPPEEPAPVAVGGAPPPRRRGVLGATALVAALAVLGATVGLLALRGQAGEDTARVSSAPLDLAGPERPVAHLAAPAPDAQAFRGRGTGTAVLDGDALPAHGGRLEILLTLAETGPVRWSVLGAALHRDGPDRVIVVQTRNQMRGVPVPVSLPYASAPPTAVHVAVPVGVEWGLVVLPDP